jgi:quinol monooxygenase YgiN
VPDLPGRGPAREYADTRDIQVAAWQYVATHSAIDAAPRKLMIIVIAQFEFPAASGEAVRQVVRDMDAETAKEEGCIYYRHAVDVCEPNRIVLSEVWAHAAALKAHFGSAHFAAFRVASRQLGIRAKVQQFEASEIDRSAPSYWKTLRDASAPKDQG